MLLVNIWSLKCYWWKNDPYNVISEKIIPPMLLVRKKEPQFILVMLLDTGFYLVIKKRSLKWYWWLEKKTGWASDDKKYPTGLLVRKKKTNKLLVWLSKLIQYPGKEETAGLTNRKKDTWLGPTQPIRVGVDNECATTFGVENSCQIAFSWGSFFDNRNRVAMGYHRTRMNL